MAPSKLILHPKAENIQKELSNKLVKFWMLVAIVIYELTSTLVLGTLERIGWLINVGSSVGTQQIIAL